MSVKTQKLIGRPKGNGSQIVFEAISRRILSMDMLPGAAIDENALVAEFGVSRTPVREALLRLASDGLVTLAPNRGASVSALDLQDIPELIEAMELCMRVTSRWAAARRTPADLEAMEREQVNLRAAIGNDDYLALNEANSGFHRAVAKASRNRHMAKLYKDLLPQYHRLTLSLLSTARSWAPNYPDYLNSLHDEHNNLLDAIRDGDMAKADKLAQFHAGRIGERLESYIWKSISNPIEVFDPTPRKAEIRQRSARPEA